MIENLYLLGPRLHTHGLVDLDMNQYDTQYVIKFKKYI